MDDGRIGYGMPAKQRGHEIAANWAPLQELLTKEKPWAVDTYVQGWALTHFFTFDKTRAQEFRAYLRALNSGESLADAAKVFGDLNQLDREARAYVTSGSFEYRPVKVEIAEPVIEKVRTLSPGEAALIPEAIAYDDTDLNQIDKKAVRDHEQARRERNLERTRQVAQQYPTDPFALYFLAEAEYSSGNYAQAQAAADRLLAIDPNNVHALARKAMTMAVQARSLPAAQKSAILEKARAMAANANHLDTQDPLPLLAYYETFHEAGEQRPRSPSRACGRWSRPTRATPCRASCWSTSSPRSASGQRRSAGSPRSPAIPTIPGAQSARTKMAWLKAQLSAQGSAQAAK